MALDHETIVSWTPRNMITIAAMAILGFFILHLLTVNASVVGAWLSGVSGSFGQSGSVNIGGPGADYDYSVDAYG
jgi:hypothetical protein